MGLSITEHFLGMFSQPSGLVIEYLHTLGAKLFLGFSGVILAEKVFKSPVLYIFCIFFMTSEKLK